MALAVVVEDESPIRMQIADTLADAGWEVGEFGSGELALDFLNQGHEVAVLVTDIRLTGDITGWDVADAYRAANPATRIIYCSGNSPNLHKQVAGSTFMPKPCRMDSILSAVQG